MGIGAWSSRASLFVELRSAFEACQPSITVALDYDSVTEANSSAGLICDQNVGLRKTRVCATWLEERGIKSTVVERAFDANTKVNASIGEPYVALCGFDSAQARALLENAGFHLVVEAGLGGGIDSFDSIMLHTSFQVA